MQDAADLRGPNHIMYSRRSSANAVRGRIRKLFAAGKWAEVHLHGLGAAIAPAVALAASLVEESSGELVASTTTSTVMLIDRDMPADLEADESCRVRHNSAVHISLKRRTAAAHTADDSAKPSAMDTG